MLKISETALKPLKRRAGAQMSMTVQEAMKYRIEWEIVLNLLNLKLARATGIIRAMLFISTLFISSDLDKGGGGGEMFSETDFKIVNF